MKIRLVNFLCYSDTTFDFGNEGLTLISGPSGTGKTSILRGVFFALFGTGNKLQSYGKTSTRVELQFDKISIVRTKRPNRLVVNDVHEDEAGQEIINRYFGNTYKTTGYIQQSNLSSFILKSPNDKLEMLEMFSCRDVQISDIKKRLKVEMLSARDELTSVTSQLNMITQILTETKKPTTVVFPIKCSGKQRDKVIKNEGIRYKNSGVLIKKEVRKLERSQTELVATKVLDANTESQQNRVSELEEQISTGITEKSEMSTGDLLEHYQTMLTAVNARQDVYDLRTRYSKTLLELEKLTEDETKNMNALVTEWSNSLYTEYSIEDLSSTISDTKSIIRDCQNLQQLESGMIAPELVDIDDLINKINTKETLLEKRRKDYQSLEAAQNTYKCPSCSSLLKMKGVILHKCEDDIQTVSGDLDSVQDDINCLTRDVRKLNKERSKYDHRRADREETEAQINDILKQYEESPVLEELEGDLEYLLDYKASQKELSKKLDKLTSKIESGEMSSACEMFKKKVSQLRRKLDQLEGDSRVGESLEIEDRDLLTTLIDKEKDDKLSMRNLCKNIKRMEDELINTISEVSRKSEIHIETYGKVRSVNHIETYVKKYKDEISRLNVKREEHASNIEKIEEWQRYQEKLIAYKKLVTQADQLSHKEKEDRKKYGAMMTLKQKILEAESLVLLNIIDIINTHARTYLDAFFPDNPISVQLTPFKTTKKTTKPSISVQIEYKGMECDMHMLSGGELSRVVLAYTLALAEMFNTPLLMLDECTASLDQDMTGVVFDAIRDNFSGKLVLIIAHQVISGTFDKVVKL